MFEMRVYNNFFIGIPLPKSIEKEYKKLTDTLADAMPNIRINKARFLHITVLFLGQQKKDSIDEISYVVNRHLPLLKGEDIVIQGLGYFNNKFMDVIHLKIEKIPALVNFYENVRDDLIEFTTAEKRNFDPHLTIARVKIGKLKDSSLHLTKESKNLLDEICWKFPVTEVGLFGREAENRNKPVLIKRLKV